MGRSRYSSRRERPSPQAEITAQLGLLKDLVNDPVALRATAVEFIQHASSLEVTRAAIVTLQGMNDPANRDVLHRRYEVSGEKNDSGGFIRAAIVRALQPIVSVDDRPLLMRALNTYQMQGMYEISAELRTAALIAMN
ncbi:MAG TPA: hypothetical protein VFQ54_09575, partial [Thermomicrobiales bacterium]|nr:hypothetical protein [Thermomicrobiales bacterium]